MKQLIIYLWLKLCLNIIASSCYCFRFDGKFAPNVSLAPPPKPKEEEVEPAKTQEESQDSITSESDDSSTAACMY